MGTQEQVFKPGLVHSEPVSERALQRVGLMLQIKLKRPVDVVRATQEGLPASAMDALIHSGFKSSEVSWIVPTRTLSHRKAKHERLTSNESGRWFRAAKILALAVEVFGDAEKAMRWLHKPRKSFDGLSAIELMKTEAGAELVEEALGQIDSGYAA